LVELMVVLALLAVLITIGVPGFTRFIDNNHTKATSEELLAMLQYARSHAVENRTQASVCTADGQVSVRTRCAGGDTLRVLEGSGGTAIGAESADLQFHSNGSASDTASYTVCRGGDFANGFTIGVERSGQLRLYPRGRKSGGAAMTVCESEEPEEG
jgi:Tfp pilus assembly protein FimT